LGALAFLVIHIVTEILAQRVHVIDAAIPFLSPYRTFYIGLGTIASDLILLIVITSIFRKRFTAHGKAWRWRAIHYSSYLAFVFGVLHGLLGGRAAKPYVDWSYGFAIALTALALVVRFLAISLRPKEAVSAPPGADQASGSPGYPGTSPLHSEALSMTQAQLGGTIQMLPAAVTHAAIGMPGSQPWAAIPAPGWSATSGPFPALSASPGYAADFPYGGYKHAELMPLGAPVHGTGVAVGAGGCPYAADPRPGPAAVGQTGGQPPYEPEYDGPPRFMGAPRKHVPQDDVSSYPYGPQSYRQPGIGYADHRGESQSGPGQALGAANPGLTQRTRAAQLGRVDPNSGPLARASTGPMPRLATGPPPRADSGPMPRLGTGSMPRAAGGPMPRAGSGPMPRLGTGPMPRAGTGPMPRAGTGPMPRADSGPMPRLGTGPMPRLDSGASPRVGTGPMPRADSGPMPQLRTGPESRPDSRPAQRSGTGPVPRPGTGQNHLSPARPNQRVAPGPRHAAAPKPRSDSLDRPRMDATPRAAGGRSRRADSTEPRHHDAPGRRGGAGWG
jgi:hypothetical protein